MVQQQVPVAIREGGATTQSVISLTDVVGLGRRQCYGYWWGQKGYLEDEQRQQLHDSGDTCSFFSDQAWHSLLRATAGRSPDMTFYAH